MNTKRPRESRHGLLKLAALALPLLTLLGCESASSGHAPGLAGGQTVTPGITNYPLVYIKQPVLTATAPKGDKAATRTGHRRARPDHLHHRQRPLYPQYRERRRRRGQRHRLHHRRHRRRARSRRVAGRLESGVLAAHAARPDQEKRRSQAAPLAHLSVRRHRQDGHSAHQRRHHRRPRRGRALSAGRPDRVRLDASARDPVDIARRRPPAVPGRDRQSPAVHLSAARHECGRQRHASDQLQYQP